MKWSDLRIERKLGEGKAGEVLLAVNTDERTCRDHPQVAVKRYKSWVLQESGQLERIMREVHVGRLIQHPNLVETLQLLFDEHGRPALVMRYYDGQTLADLVRSASFKPKASFVFGLLEKLSSAITALHRAGVVHRDLKPANIFLSGSEPIIMDLGVVKSNEFPEQTSTGQFLGTIAYAAPEALFGEKCDHRMDFFSLGLILHEVFTGRAYYVNSHWAKLVAEKYEIDHVQGGPRGAFQRQSSDATDKASRLCRYYSPGEIEFFMHVFDVLTMPFFARPRSLSWLLRFCRQKVWEKDFYRFQKQIFLGQPTIKIRQLKSRGRTRERRVSLDQLSESLLNKLSDEERKLLHRKMHSYYTRGRLGYFAIRPSQSIIPPSRPIIYSRFKDLTDSAKIGTPQMVELLQMHMVLALFYRYHMIC